MIKSTVFGNTQYLELPEKASASLYKLRKIYVVNKCKRFIILFYK